MELVDIGNGELGIEVDEVSVMVYGNGIGLELTDEQVDRLYAALTEHRNLRKGD